jgi:hypothetical protein
LSPSGSLIGAQAPHQLLKEPFRFTKPTCNDPDAAGTSGDGLCLYNVTFRVNMAAAGLKAGEAGEGAVAVDGHFGGGQGTRDPPRFEQAGHGQQGTDAVAIGADVADELDGVSGAQFCHDFAERLAGFAKAGVKLGQGRVCRKRHKSPPSVPGCLRKIIMISLFPGKENTNKKRAPGPRGGSGRLPYKVQKISLALLMIGNAIA